MAHMNMSIGVHARKGRREGKGWRKANEPKRVHMGMCADRVESVHVGVTIDPSLNNDKGWYTMPEASMSRYHVHSFRFV